VKLHKHFILNVRSVELTSLVKMALNMQQRITIAAWAITYANDREESWTRSMFHCRIGFTTVLHKSHFLSL
ncbi:hypothetical protein L9F63_003893, partial [Diploptera punctata]